MGNRAYVAFADDNPVAVYLHWNGGPESVYTFLDCLKEAGVRLDDYGPARFCQMIGNFFGDTLSVGVSAVPLKDGKPDWAALAHEENGLYVVREGWEVDRYLNRSKLSAQRVAQERREASEHRYNKPDGDGETLADSVRDLNPRLFVKETVEA